MQFSYRPRRALVVSFRPLMAACSVYGLLAAGCTGSTQSPTMHVAEEPALPDAGSFVATPPAADDEDTEATGEPAKPDASQSSSESPAHDQPTIPRHDNSPEPGELDAGTDELATTAPPDSTSSQPPRPHLPPLPSTSAGPCAFAVETTPSAVDNPSCPDGIFHGDLVIESPGDATAAIGCRRIKGNVTVYGVFVNPLAELSSLRVIDGDLYFQDWLYENRPAIIRESTNLIDLSALAQLTCVAGDLLFEAIQLPFPQTPTLERLVEVGGNFSVPYGSQPFAAPMLRRIWGNLEGSSTLTAPQLESVYGNLTAPLDPSSTPYVGCSGSDYCRDGVLGCDYYASSQAALDRLTRCEYVVNGVRAELFDMDLTPLANLKHARSLTFSVEPDSGEQLRHPEALSKLESIRQLWLTGFSELDQLGWLHKMTQFYSLSLTDLPALTDLRDLNELRSLASLSLKHTGVRNLAGLDSLESCGRLDLTDNAQLVDLTGAPQWVRGEALWLANDPALQDLSNLAHLPLTQLSLQHLPALASLPSFPHAQLETLYVIDLPQLATLDGLEGLSPVMSTLSIESNATLRTIEALSAARQVDFLTVTDNLTLSSFRGLEGLTSVVNARVTNNPHAPQCELNPLFNSHPYSIVSGNDVTAVCMP